MGIDLIIYRARVGLHYHRHLNLKGLKPFTDFESILFLSILLSRSGDIETNPGPTSSSEPRLILLRQNLLIMIYCVLLKPG